MRKAMLLLGGLIFCSICYAQKLPSGYYLFEKEEVYALAYDYSKSQDPTPIQNLTETRKASIDENGWYTLIEYNYDKYGNPYLRMVKVDGGNNVMSYSDFIQNDQVGLHPNGLLGWTLSWKIYENGNWVIVEMISIDMKGCVDGREQRKFTLAGGIRKLFFRKY